MRILDFADGFDSPSAPTLTNFSAGALAIIPVGNLSSTNAQAGFEELQGDIDTINAKRGAANGFASLGSDGKIPAIQIPALALVDVSVVANIAARDALTVQEGDVAVVTDAGSGVAKTYIYDGSTWIELIANGSITAHINNTSGAHAASAIAVTPSGNLSSTNAQAALVELQSDIDTRATATALAAQKSVAEVLTNKDIDGGTASNTQRLTVPKNTKTNLDALTRKEATLVYGSDTKKVYFDNGTSLSPVGSGSGGGSLNYVANPDFETDLSGWATYNDGLSATPFDATGGTALTTFTRNTTTYTSLRGTACGLLSRPASMRQGEGVSTAFTIDPADRGAVLQVGFDYAIAAGVYADGDVQVFVVDSANTLIYPSENPLVLNHALPSARHSFRFQATTATSYRLALHIASATTTFFDMLVDNVSVGPQFAPKGAFVGNAVAYTPTFTGLGTVTNIDFKYYQVGPRMRVIGSALIGTVSTSVASITLPPGTSVDSSIGSGVKMVGRWTSDSTTVNHLKDFAVLANSGSGNVLGLSTIDYNSALNPLNAQPANQIIISNLNVSFDFDVPIQGWSSNQGLSSEVSGRLIAARATLSATSASIATGTMTKVPINLADFDKSGALDAVNNRFIAQENGPYRISATINWTNGNGVKLLSYRLNGGPDNYIGVIPSADRVFAGTTLDLKARDYIEIWARQDSGVSASISPGVGNTAVSFEKIVAGSQQTAATADISIKYANSTAQSINNTGVILNFADKLWASHGAWNGNTFTAPEHGEYRVTCKVLFDNAAWATGDFAEMSIVTTGIGGGVLDRPQVHNNASLYISCGGTGSVKLLAGQTVQISLVGKNGTALIPSDNWNYLEIKRTGGY